MKIEKIPSKIGAKDLKKNYPDLYSYIEDLLKTPEFEDIPHVSSFLKVYLRIRSLSREMTCSICGSKYDPYKGRVDSCSRKCSSKINWQNNRDNIENGLNKSIDSRLEKDPRYFSKMSKRSYQTRKSVYTEDELKKQYETITEKRVNKMLLNKSNKEKDFVTRLQNIDNIHNVIIKFVNIYSVQYKTYCKYIKFLTECGIDTTFEPSYTDFHIIKGKVNTCLKCGKLIIGRLPGEYIFCSKKCASKHYSNIDSVRITKSIKSKEAWKNGEYREKVLGGRDYKEWSEKMLNTLGVEGRILRSEAAIKTKLERGLISEVTDEYKKYRGLVWKHTNRSIKHTILK